MNKRSVAQDSVNNETISNKIMKPNGSNNSGPVLSEFLLWCNSSGMKISKSIEVVDVCRHRYGMKATEFIKTGDVIFDVPRSMLLWEENYSNEISSLSSVKSESGWVKLLLVLMLEYYNPKSKWRPYLDFLPSSEIMDIPFNWESDVRNNILGVMKLDDLVNRDVKNIECEYYNIVLPFIKANKKFGFDQSLHTLELYKRMVGCVMAYSFTEPCDDPDNKSPPKMVPMADVLNHISAHNAQLHFDEDSLKMVAIVDIFPGSEIFNTYGHLSNSELLQMYGFVEQNNENRNDTVKIPIQYFKKEDEIDSCNEKWDYLFRENNGVLFGCDDIAVGKKGIYSCDETNLILKILCMSKLDFASYKEEEWESDGSSGSETSSDSVAVLSHSKISSFPPGWKSLLKHASERYYNELVALLHSKQNINFDDMINSERKNKVVSLLEQQISILFRFREVF